MECDMGAQFKYGVRRNESGTGDKRKRCVMGNGGVLNVSGGMNSDPSIY